MKKVLITRRLPIVAKQLLEKYFVVDYNDVNKPLEYRKLIEAVSKYNAILSTVTEIFDEEILSFSKDLEIISNYATGIDNINSMAAEKRGITICNLSTEVVDSTADLTIALLLKSIRKLGDAEKFVSTGHWNVWNPELFLGEELSGKTMGIIGFGKIGQAVAKRAVGFGLDIIYNNTSLIDISSDKMKQVDFKTLLKTSDFISLHLPLKTETKHIISHKEFLKMSKNPIIINMSRGPIINTNALVKALKSKLIRGACLDVTDPEPIPKSHELCKLNNCLIVPHIGTATHECREKMAEGSAQKIIDFYDSKNEIQRVQKKN